MLKVLTAAGSVALAALAIASASLGGSTATTLKGTVGPGFTITLTQAGHKVTTLKAGTYQLVVSDRSSEHNFVLRGPGATRSLSSVGAMSSRTLTIKLTKGAWTYYCAPHADEMRGTFRVT